MSIIRAGIYSAAATTAKLSSSLAIIKIVAWYAGPEGVGKLGQFLSLMSLVSVFAGGGIASGVIKYVAEYKDNPVERLRLLRGASSYTFIAAIMAALIIAFLSMPLSEWIFGDKRFHNLIILLALAQLLVAVNNFILAIINGHMDVKRVALINIAGSLLGLAATAILAYYFQLDGALYALVIGQAMLLGVSYPIFKQSKWYDRIIFKPGIDWSIFRLLAHYSLMTLTSAILAPLVQITVRNHLAARFSWEEVGYWQAVSKVSDAYLLAITMVISVYYLPKLSAIVRRRELISELKSAYLYVMPLVVFVAIFIYLLRDNVTILLFSVDFIDARDLYAPQLIGDVFKIASFVLSYMMIAKAMTRIFIFSEITFSLTYVALVWLMSDKYGLVGSMYAFTTNYGFYLVFNWFMIKRYLKNID